MNVNLVITVTVIILGIIIISIITSNITTRSRKHRQIMSPRYNMLDNSKMYTLPPNINC